MSPGTSSAPIAERGTIVEGESLQFFDPEASAFSPTVMSKAPARTAAMNKARGDQCDNCGRTLDPIDLINPRSRSHRSNAGSEGDQALVSPARSV